MRRSWSGTLLASVSLVLVAVLTGCGSGNNSSNSSSGGSSGASSSSAVCSDLATLEASAKKLQNVTLTKGVGAEIQSDAAQVGNDLRTLSNDSSAQFSLQLDQLTQSLKALAGAASTLAGDPTSRNMSLVQTALRDVSTSYQSLVSAVGGTC